MLSYSASHTRFFSLSSVDFSNTMSQQQLAPDLKSIFQGPEMADSESCNLWRSIFVEDIPEQAKAKDVLNIVTAGVVEHVRYLPHKGCAFISFLDHLSATHFYADFIMDPKPILGRTVRLGWAQAPVLPKRILDAVLYDNACRNVYLGMLPPDITDQKLCEQMGQFGEIENVRILPENSIAFVHFMSIRSALKAVHTLRRDPEWSERKVAFGKDRCFNISRLKKQGALLYLGLAPNNAQLLTEYSPQVIATALTHQATATVSVASLSGGGPANVGNRCIYLGGLHKDTQIDEICNATRGGMLESIRYLSERHICFVRFADPTAAAYFFAMWNIHRLYIHSKFVKVSWGKNCGPLSSEISEAIARGATRNVFLGGVSPYTTHEQIYAEFSRFGIIEQINVLPERNCAFVNFTDVGVAIQTVEWARSHPTYSKLRVRYGKDRCANQPWILQQIQGQFHIPILLQYLQAHSHNGMFMYPPLSTLRLQATVPGQARASSASPEEYSEQTPEDPSDDE